MIRRIHTSEGRRREEGFVLLLTLLIISIMLALSLSVFEVSLKDIMLASFVKDSQRALQAADRGAECALSWDRSSLLVNGVQFSIFASTSAYTNPPQANLAVCHDGAASQRLNLLPSWSVADLSPTTGRTTFSLDYSDGTCVTVGVWKNDIETTVTADGYNTCAAGATRRTQRTIQIFSNI